MTPKRAWAQGRLGASLGYAGIVGLGGLGAALGLAVLSGSQVSLATSAMIMGIAASGLGFLWGQAGEVTIAHSAVFGVGAYTAGIAADDHGLSFAASLGFSILAGGIAALAVSLLSLRTRGHYFVILTFALGEVAVVVAERLVSITGGIDGMTVIPQPERILGLQVDDGSDFFVLTLITTVIVLLFLRALGRSSFGATLRGIRENEALAAALGTPVAAYRIAAFVIAGVCAGLAGQFFLYNVDFIDPTLFNANSSIFFLLMVLLGGRRYLLGPLVGAIIYEFLPGWIHLAPNVAQMVFGLLLIGLILALPDGLLSAADRLSRIASRRRTPGSAQPLQTPALVVNAPRLE